MLEAIVSTSRPNAAGPADETVRAILFQAVRQLVFNVVKHARADPPKNKPGV
jgi:hypothetical protein